MGFPARMRRLLSTRPGRLVRELGAFGVVGGVCFLVDIALFQLLYAHVGVGAVTSKLLSTLVSMTFAFLGHRFWSFAGRARTGLRREYSLFAVVNGSTLLLGLAIVAFVRYPLGQEGALVLQLANVGSIAVGTVIRFLAYRRWVFPAPAADAADTPVRDAESSRPMQPS
ncbi:GtrA family protein [Blastococcus capsensis]|uniref:GtrA family protein n=1 Tax=Blastococcus capsensis TaxID=1564163 RepID=UPI002540CCBC|nr:GtrA family protein [Blastococcus capsensis]MDK3256158.1 GtrA family protein [Blastococcus capsensis]